MINLSNPSVFAEWTFDRYHPYEPGKLYRIVTYQSYWTCLDKNWVIGHPKACTKLPYQFGKEYQAWDQTKPVLYLGLSEGNRWNVVLFGEQYLTIARDLMLVEFTLEDAQ